MCLHGKCYGKFSVMCLMLSLCHLENEHRKLDFADPLKDKGDVWDKIVESNGLYSAKMEEITCFNEIQFILKNLNTQDLLVL